MKKEVLVYNSNEYRKLTLYAKMMTALSDTETVYYVGNTYLDYGQDWMWTTIIAQRENGDTYQALSPAEWEEVLLSKSVVELAQLVEDYFNGPFCCDTMRKF